MNPKPPVVGFRLDHNKVRKIGIRIVEALLLGNPVEVIRESLDCMQTHWTLINMVAKEYGMNIDKLYQEHCRKLVRKGYEEGLIKNGRALTLQESGLRINFRGRWCKG